MGLFDLFQNKEEIERKKNEKSLKQGWVYSTEILPNYEKMVENHEWEKALRYCLSNKFVDDLSRLYEPYFPNDSREVADGNRMIFINHIFQKYCSIHRNVAEESMLFLAKKFNNLRKVPVKDYVSDGRFNQELYDMDSDRYNPFINYFDLAKDISFDPDTVQILYDLYEQKVITDKDLLGLTRFYVLFDKHFFDTMYLEEHIRKAKSDLNGN